MANKRLISEPFGQFNAIHLASVLQLGLLVGRSRLPGRFPVLDFANPPADLTRSERYRRR
jgi:hypothetical protein